MFKKKKNNPEQLEVKIREFQMAMERYNKRFFYHKASWIISILVLCLQATSLLGILQLWQEAHYLSVTVAFIVAYIVTDFINGMVHLYMDNNTHYNSIVGPFIAAFHLHHIKPRYKKKHPLIIYFHESGTKFWLVIYLIIVVLIQHYVALSFAIQFGLTCIGILSSFAEVSHYWCHTRGDNSLINILQKYGVLLSEKNHLIHHISDNQNYAFLNGISNPLINKIACYWYDGYKNHADQHAQFYSGKQTNNRL